MKPKIVVQLNDTRSGYNVISTEDDRLTVGEVLNDTQVDYLVELADLGEIVVEFLEG
jgi:hypothetical protein